MHNAQKSKLAEALFFLFSLSLSCGPAVVKLLICPRRELRAWVTLGAAFSGDLDTPLALALSLSLRRRWGQGSLRWGHKRNSRRPGLDGDPDGGQRRQPEAYRHSFLLQGLSEVLAGNLSFWSLVRWSEGSSLSPGSHFTAVLLATI